MAMSSIPRVAICQPRIIAGGRLRVILGMVQILNEVGIVPHILTSRLSLRPDEIQFKYGLTMKAHFRMLPRLWKLKQDTAIIVFNLMLSHYAADYDLLVNTSNSLLFLPKRKSVLTYMFFPRKGRILASDVDIHKPEMRTSWRSRAAWRRALLRMVYSVSKPHAHHAIVCMTNYTQSVLRQAYELPANLPVIYPPVDVSRFLCRNPSREPSVVTIGRFGGGKRQLEQILLAERLPNTLFRIVGFVSDSDYYESCAQYVIANGLRNVDLFPDAPFEQMVTILQSSKYFLHTLINEPFGLTAVEAIAAGCLPIVHDSGGSRETVPVPELRYQHLDQVPAIIASLESMDEAERRQLLGSLQEHVTSHFDASLFHRRMRDLLLPLLGIGKD